VAPSDTKDKPSRYECIENHHVAPETRIVPGPSRQERSAMRTDGCRDALLTACDGGVGLLATDTHGSRTATAVTRSADIVADEPGLDPADASPGGE